MLGPASGSSAALAARCSTRFRGGCFGRSGGSCEPELDPRPVVWVVIFPRICRPGTFPDLAGVRSRCVRHVPAVARRARTMVGRVPRRARRRRCRFGVWLLRGHGVLRLERLVRFRLQLHCKLLADSTPESGFGVQIPRRRQSARGLQQLGRKLEVGTPGRRRRRSFLLRRRLSWRRVEHGMGVSSVLLASPAAA